VALAMVGISNYTSGVFGPAQDRRILGYDAGLTRNPNDLALMLNLIIPITVVLLLWSKTPLERGLLVAALSLQGIAVVLTFSRAGFLTLATTSAIFALRLLRRPSWGLVLAALALLIVALPFMPSGYAERLLTLRAIDADPTGSSQARWGGTVAALEHVAEHPVLGAGLGMNILVLNETVGATWRVVHNTYLEYAVDLGLPGLGLFVLLLFRCWKGARSVRRLARPELAQLAEGIEISLIGFAVAAVFQPVAYQFYFFYIAGLSVAAQTVFAGEAPRRLDPVTA
jgi:O-antigen ligase